MVDQRKCILQIRTNCPKDTCKQAISTASIDKVAAAPDERKEGSLASSRLGPSLVLVQRSENDPGTRGPHFQPWFGHPILNFRAEVPPPIKTRRKERNPHRIPDRMTDTNLFHLTAPLRGQGEGMEHCEVSRSRLTVRIYDRVRRTIAHVMVDQKEDG